MKKYMKVFILLYFAGFGAGILCANLLLKKTGYQTSLLSAYLTVSDTFGGRSFFLRLLRLRGGYFLAGSVCGTMVLGIPAALASLLWFGFLAGNLAACFLLEYGIRGLAVCGACFFPQALFYIPGWLLFFFVISQMSRKAWEKKRKTKEDYKAYCFFLSGIGVLLLLGIWMESYVNQNTLGYVLSHWL